MNELKDFRRLRPETEHLDDDTSERVWATIAGTCDPGPSSHQRERGDASGDHELVFVDSDTSVSTPPRRYAVLAAAAVIAIGVTGIVALQNGDRTPTEPPGVAAEPTSAAPAVEPSETVPAPPAIEYDVAEPVSSVDPRCSNQTADECDPYADLPIEPGASDFSVGPASLGTPVVALEEFDMLTRCAELDAVGTTCAELEGIAGVPLVRYGSDIDASDVTIDTSGGQSINADDIEIGTTFADVTPKQYADEWGIGMEAGDATRTDVTVRGHTAIELRYPAARFVVWNDRPGVLTWVRVPEERGDELLDIAEGVRLATGPETIPWKVVVPDDVRGQGYEAGSNDGATLLIGKRAGGGECVGFGYLDGTCGDDIGDRVFVRTVDNGNGLVDRALVTGTVPAGVARVRLLQDGQVLAEVDSRPLPPTISSSRFFTGFVDVEGEVTVEWLDGDGTPVADTSVDVDFCDTSCG